MILPVSILFPFPLQLLLLARLLRLFYFLSSTSPPLLPSYLLVKFWFTRCGRRAIKSKLTSRCSIKDNGARNNTRWHKVVAKTCVNVSTAFPTLNTSNAVFLGGKEWRRMPVIFYGNSIKFLELKERKRGRPFFRRFTTPPPGDGLLFLMVESVMRRNGVFNFKKSNIYFIYNRSMRRWAIDFAEKIEKRYFCECIIFLDFF